jgi:hypothetical protein
MQGNELIGELREFKRATLEELREIKRDIKALNEFRWKLTGKQTVILLVFNLAMTAIEIVVMK